MNKGQELSKGAVAAIIAVVVIVVCFLGYRFFIAPGNGVPSKTREMYMERMKNAGTAQSSGGTSQGSPGSGGRPSSGGSPSSSGGPGSGGSR